MSRREIHNRVSYISLLVLSASLPTYTFFTNLAITILIANWFFEGQFKSKIDLIRQRPLIWLLVGFFLLHIAGMIFTADQREGWRNVEKKILLLAFPIVLGTSSWDLDKTSIKNILLLFALSCLVVSLFSLGVGFSRYLSDDTTEYLFHEGLTEKIGAQPIYFGMYICFAAVIFFWLLISLELKNIVRFLLVAAIIFLILFSVLLSARIALALLLLISAIGGYNFSKKLHALKLFWGLGVVTIVACVIVVANIPVLKERVMELVNTKFYFSPEENNANGLTLRLVKWQCSIEGLAANPIVGVGTGDTQEFLQACYKEKNFWGEVFRYNSHNQFLQSALGLGLPGLLTLVACLWYQTRIAWAKKDYVYLVFIVIICVCFLTESVLERKQGILFYGLFSALLPFYPVSRDQ